MSVSSRVKFNSLSILPVLWWNNCVIENDFAFSHVVLGNHSLIQKMYIYKFSN